MYTWIPIATLADIAKWSGPEGPIGEQYGPKSVAARLTAGLTDDLKGILVEENYTDKDYRSTYYNYYTKKAQSYRADCVRLHFFTVGVSFDAERYLLEATSGDVNQHYLGFMVLRPTGIATIGRSVLSPEMRRNVNGLIIATKYHVHLLGADLTVCGFPSMDQHIDISVCAHVACWSILRHYSQRYGMYKEFLTYDITLMAQEFNPGGLLPSKGLNINHAERVFQGAGTYPILVTKRSDSDQEFYRQLISYIDSGFPVFGVLRDRGHAMAIIGYELEEDLPAIDGQLHTWDSVKSLVVVDDNQLPYINVEVGTATRDPLPYTTGNIHSFIVALPEKIFYPPEAIDGVIRVLNEEFDEVIGNPPEDTVVRYFISTGSDLRGFVKANASEFDQQLYRVIMAGLPFAQYVWIIEYSKKDQWGSNQIIARAVLDATASVHEQFPVWLLHNEKHAVACDRQNIAQNDRVVHFKLTGARQPLTRMNQNLRQVA